MTRRTVAALSVSFGTILSAVASWLLVWFFARSGGGTDIVGAYSVILAYASPVFVICQLGLRTIVLSSQHKWPWGTYWLLRWVGVLIGSLGLVILFSVTSSMDTGLGIAVVALKVCDSFLDLHLAAIQYRGKLVLLGVLMLTNATLTIVVAGIAVWLTGSPATAISLSALSSGLVALVAWVEVRKLSYRSHLSTGAGTLYILRASVPVTLSQFLGAFLFQIPVFFIAKVADDHITGIFAAAAYLLTVANVVGGTLQTLFITSFRNIFESNGRGQLEERSRALALKTFLTGSCIGVVVLILGDKAFTFIYGDEFRIGLTSLALLVVGAVSTSIAFVYSVTLTVLNRYRDIMFAMGIACVLSILTGFLLSFVSLQPLTIGCAMAGVGALSRLIVMIGFTKRA